MRKGKQRKSQSRTGRARPVAFLWPKYMVFEILYYTCHPWHIGIAESPVWKTIDCASWLLGGWRWRAGKWHLQRRCQDPESWARAAAPPSSIQHQTELTRGRGATTPLPQLWRPWSNSNSVLLTIFSCSFVSYFYLHVPRFCHRLVLRTCLPGLCLPLQIATSHYTHPDKLQTSDVLHPSKIPKPWWVSSIRNCFSNTMSVI